MKATVDVVDGRTPGGANTSHTIAVPLIKNLLAAGGPSTTLQEYETVAIDQNVLGRGTFEGRRRTFRYLRELYLLDGTRLLFRGLRDLWSEDPAAQEQLAGLSAFARDSVFRAGSAAVLDATVGDTVRADDIARAVNAVFPDAYNAATLHKIGRNSASSWTQTGHLVGKTGKARAPFRARPVASVFAAFIGHLEGRRGQDLLSSSWTRFLCLPPERMSADLREATQRGYVEFRSGGGVVECGFSHLLRPTDGVFV